MNMLANGAVCPFGMSGWTGPPADGAVFLALLMIFYFGGPLFEKVDDLLRIGPKFYKSRRTRTEWREEGEMARLTHRVCMVCALWIV